MVEVEDLVMPPPKTLFEIASAPPPPAEAAAPAVPGPPQVVQMSQAATMIAAMNDTEKGLFDDLLADELRDLDGFEAERVDVARIDGIGVHDHRLAEVDGFQEGIAETL